jgi:hypothetical protein
MKKRWPVLGLMALYVCLAAPSMMTGNQSSRTSQGKGGKPTELPARDIRAVCTPITPNPPSWQAMPGQTVTITANVTSHSEPCYVTVTYSDPTKFAGTLVDRLDFDANTNSRNLTVRMADPLTGSVSISFVGLNGATVQSAGTSSPSQWD